MLYMKMQHQKMMNNLILQKGVDGFVPSSPMKGKEKMLSC